MKNENELVATMAKDELEILTAAAARLQEMAAGGGGSGRFTNDDSPSTICSLTSKVAQLASRHAEDKNTGEHHAFAAKAHDLAEHARSLAGEVDAPDTVRRYHGDTSANHRRVATALGHREASPTIHQKSSDDFVND